MANYAIKLDLKKIQGTFVTKIAGKTQTKTCICIPTDSTGIFLGEKGCYLDLVAWEMENPKYEDTHSIKPNLSKSLRDSLTEEQRRSIPFIGGLRPLEQKGGAAHATGSTEVEDPNDLPF